MQNAPSKKHDDDDGDAGGSDTDDDHDLDLHMKRLKRGLKLVFWHS